MTALYVHRLRALEEATQSPPHVHRGAPDGVWRTHDSLYRFLAEWVGPESRTLETGLGISTALFAAWGADHTCVVGSAVEIEMLRDWLDERGWSADRIAFLVGSSDDVLPALRPEPFDLMLIDGCHGFPFPALDWYYGARWLKAGGILVFDDLQIPAVAATIGWFLDLDPRWEELARNERWAAYRRLSEGPLSEEWTEQLFLGDPR